MYVFHFSTAGVSVSNKIVTTTLENKLQWMTVLDQDDDSDFEDLFWRPELEEHWKEQVSQAEQFVRH